MERFANQRGRTMSDSALVLTSEILGKLEAWFGSEESVRLQC